MICIVCNGTGIDVKENKLKFMKICNCPICKGTGHVCDQCGESCEEGMDLCVKCESIKEGC